MNLSQIVSLTVVLIVLATVRAQSPQQQQIDPAFLRDYYAQISQQNVRGAASGSEATPIYEQQSAQPQSQPQYISPGQQIRVRDSVSDQIRAQQQSPYVAPTVRQYLQQPQQQQLQYQPPTYQQQNIQYNRPQTPAKQTLALPRRPQSQPQYQAVQQGPRLNKDEEEEYDSSPNYQFGFDVKDDEFTNYQNRKEVRDGNVIKGSYSVVDSDGFLRTVTYTADPKEGFKADVVREPTDIVVKIPTPAPQNSLRGQSQSQPQYSSQQSPAQYRSLPRQPQQQQQLRQVSQASQHQPQQQQYQPQQQYQYE